MNDLCTHAVLVLTQQESFLDWVKMLEADNACKIHGESPLDQQGQSRLPATQTARAS